MTDHTTDPLRDRIAEAVEECRTLTPAALADAVLAVLPTADRAAVLREAADRIDRTDLPQDDVDMFDNGARWATKLLRRMADEAQPETPSMKLARASMEAMNATLRRPATEVSCTCADAGDCFAPAGHYADCPQVDEAQPAGPATDDEARPRRGDAFETWLKTQRERYDRHGESSEFWHEFDGALNRYRLHADMGVPLSEHVCEGRVAGDCECLEGGQGAAAGGGE